MPFPCFSIYWEYAPGTKKWGKQSKDQLTWMLCYTISMSPVTITNNMTTHASQIESILKIGNYRNSNSGDTILPISRLNK